MFQAPRRIVALALFALQPVALDYAVIGDLRPGASSFDSLRVTACDNHRVLAIRGQDHLVGCVVHGSHPLSVLSADADHNQVTLKAGVNRAP